MAGAPHLYPVYVEHIGGKGYIGEVARYVNDHYNPRDITATIYLHSQYDDVSVRWEVAGMS